MIFDDDPHSGARFSQDIAKYRDSAEEYKKARLAASGPSVSKSLDLVNPKARFADFIIVPGVVAGFITITIKESEIVSGCSQYGSGYIPSVVGTNGSTTGTLYYQKWDELMRAKNFSLNIEKQVLKVILTDEDGDPVGELLAYWANQGDEEDYTGIFGWVYVSPVCFASSE